jgi:hypothetical protein
MTIVNLCLSLGNIKSPVCTQRQFRVTLSKTVLSRYNFVPKIWDSHSGTHVAVLGCKYIPTFRWNTTSLSQDWWLVGIYTRHSTSERQKTSTELQTSKGDSYNSRYVVTNVQIANILREEKLRMLRNAFIGVTVQEGYLLFIAMQYLIQCDSKHCQTTSLPPPFLSPLQMYCRVIMISFVTREERIRCPKLMEVHIF